jgi:aminomethyltransferase
MKIETKNQMKTHLYECHQKLAAKLTPFAGYELPIWYNSLKEEHLAVRQHAGIFDIGHMGVLRLSGPTAYDDLQQLSCNDVGKTHAQKMVYSMMLDDNGGVLDDIMMGQWGEDYLVIVNASNLEKIKTWILDHKQPTTELDYLNSQYALIAIQGPEAADLVTKHISIAFSAIKPFGIQIIDTMVAMRTGYTGEDGFELLVPCDQAPTIWTTLIQAGAMPCGLASRDTLRLEKGLPLYGQELSKDITPLMTRYRWVIDWNHDFIGKEALNRQRETVLQTTVGLKMKARHIPRTGYGIQEGGYITSGTLSPSLNEPIAMAMVDQKHAQLGTELTVNIRGKLVKGTVVKIPFV